MNRRGEKPIFEALVRVKLAPATAIKRGRNGQKFAARVVTSLGPIDEFARESVARLLARGEL